MTVPEHILSYLFVELTAMGYDPDQAERAETWLKYGDWTFRGNDPVLQLADFTPTEDQFRKAYEAKNARIPSKVNAIEPRTNRQFGDFMRRYIQNDGFMNGARSNGNA